MRQRVLIASVVGVLVMLCTSVRFIYAGNPFNPSNTPLTATVAIKTCLTDSLPMLGPGGAFNLPTGSSNQLQASLDTFHSVRLDAGSYTNNPGNGVLNPAITLTSNEQLYGIAGSTLVPNVTIAAGATNVVLSGVVVGTLSFAATSGTPTAQNCIERVSAFGGDTTLSAVGAALDSNIFLGLHATILVDNHAAGTFTNNRFIDTQAGNNTGPALQLLGDPGQISDNNVFLGYTLSGPVGDGVFANNQQDLSFVGLQATDWNPRGLATRGLITTGPMGLLSLFDVHGSTTYVDSSLEPVYDVGAFSSYMQNVDLASRSGTQFVLEPTNSQYAQVASTLVPVDKASGAIRLAVGNRVVYNGLSTGLLTGASQAGAQAALVASPSGPKWEAPTFGAPPDLAGPTWNAGLSNQSDSTGYLQGLINTSAVARVPAGTYYISSPLVVKSGQGLIGSGEGNTLIIAKTPFPMIVGNDASSCPQPASPNTATCSAHVVVADLSLEGGSVGVAWNTGGSGPNALYVSPTLSHVVFRNLSSAGVDVNGIVGVKDAFWDNLAFVNTGSALRQRSVNWDGLHDRGAGYINNLTCYHCQFLANTLGWDIGNARTDTPNACVSCYFAENTNGAVVMTGGANFLFANSVFLDNGGASSIFNPTSLVNLIDDSFVTGPLSQTLFGGYGVSVVDTTFSQECSGSTQIAQTLSQLTLVDSTSKIALGSFSNGLLLNSSVIDTPYNAQGVVVSQGSIDTFLTGAPSPVEWPLTGTFFNLP